MRRIALVAALVVLPAGCASPISPERFRVGAPTASEYFHLALTGLLVAVVAYLVVATWGRPVGRVALPRRALFLVVVVSSTTFGVLTGAWFLAVQFEYLAYRTFASAVSVTWGSFLVMRFMSALDERPSLRVARAGVLLAALSVPLALAGIWVPILVGWLWSLVVTFVVTAGIAAHATYLALLPVPTHQRWLVTATRWFDAAIVLLVVVVLWDRGSSSMHFGRGLGALAAATLTGTILAEMCSLRARMGEGRLPPPPAPAHVRYCIACGSTRVVPLPDSARCEDCGTQFRADLRPRSDV